ncbi:MAG: 2-amino-4-hydroxy-6-hydroxymethyldihydropteridine diphosphokinase [Endomicrobiaceae bacterium]|nr:2-amino-4-hydroxy-6-hydroxymethyldihydropteridine diphosphokinase [Endomicrobiaceae bacterium]
MNNKFSSKSAVSKSKYYPVYLSFGSNINNRKRNIEKALAELARNNINQIKISSYYKTSPVGPEQRDFYNLVGKFKTYLTPKELLNRIKEIENYLGRVKTVKWGPRIIDMDILFYSNKIIKEKKLTVPHKEIQNRLFILQPLNEISPNLIHPIYKKQIKTLLKITLTKFNDTVTKI